MSLPFDVQHVPTPNYPLPVHTGIARIAMDVPVPFLGLVYMSGCAVVHWEAHNVLKHGGEKDVVV